MNWSLLFEGKAGSHNILKVGQNSPTIRCMRSLHICCLCLLNMRFCMIEHPVDLFTGLLTWIPPYPLPWKQVDWLS